MTSVTIQQAALVSHRYDNGFSFRRPLVQQFVLLWKILELWQERSRQRRQLLELDDRLLKDIGVSRADVEREAYKPFWKP